MRLLHLFAAILYGLLIYGIANTAWLAFLRAPLTLAFLVGGPFAIGYLSSKGMQASSAFVAAVAPLLPIAMVLGVLLATSTEETSRVVIALPLIVAGAVSGGLCAHLRRSGDAGRVELGAVLLLPLLLLPLERQFEPSDRFDESITSIEIAAGPERVWEEIAEVDTIRDAERARALYTTIGFPPPIEATLDFPQEGGIRRTRVGRDVLFKETVIEWEPEQALGLAIDLAFAEGEPSPDSVDSLGRAGEEHFAVLTSRYAIEPIDSAKVRLVLTSRHRVRTRFNRYAGWWSGRIMQSLQADVLAVLKARAEDPERPAKVRIREATRARLARESSTAREADSFETGFSVVGRLSGRTDVYADSVVVLVPDGVIAWPRLSDGEVHDSTSASMAISSGASWSEGTQSRTLRIARAVRGDSLGLGHMRRFTVPRAPGESLAGRWVLFTHFLTVPVTTDNPYGTAWTYTHGAR